MTPLLALAIIGFAALMHASFQLGVSVLTLLSGHALGRRQAHRAVLRLTTSFLSGAAAMTLLLLSSITLLAFALLSTTSLPLLWCIATGLLVGTGLAVWLFYYRPAPGTVLWLPRSLASFLAQRAKTTKLGAEAFSLGLSGVLAEIIFIAAPHFVSAQVIASLPLGRSHQGIAVNLDDSMAPLAVVWALIGGGHKVSEIQLWRERYKRFLQFIAAGGLIVLGFFVYTYQVVTIPGVTL